MYTVYNSVCEIRPKKVAMVANFRNFITEAKCMSPLAKCNIHELTIIEA